MRPRRPQVGVADLLVVHEGPEATWLRPQTTSCPKSALPAVAYLAVLCGAVGAIARMYRALGALCGALSPAASERQELRGSLAVLPWARVGLGLVLAAAAVPAAVLLTLARTDITWAGISYRKRLGRVSRIAASRDS